MPDTTPGVTQRNYNTGDLDFVTVPPRLKKPFFYKFPMDTAKNITDAQKGAASRALTGRDSTIGGGGGAGTGSGGSDTMHTVRITAIGGGGGGGGGDSASSSKAAKSNASGASNQLGGNSNASSSAESGGGGGGGGGAGNGVNLSDGGAGNGPSAAGSAIPSGTGRTLGTMEFILTNSPENRMSAQWDGTDFGLLGAALESYRKGNTMLDTLEQISKDGLGEMTEAAIRRAAGLATTVKQLALGGTAPDMISAATRKVENPFREQLFKTMNFRTFPMQFKIAPSSAAEASQVQNAIRELERHMHPEKTPVFLIYPSEFKVEFMYGGGKNKFLPTVNSCILTDMNVQYGHGGFMTSFANSQGTPTEITITLSFKEVFTRDRSHID
jgi:hypothetical protein